MDRDDTVHKLRILLKVCSEQRKNLGKTIKKYDFVAILNETKGKCNIKALRAFFTPNYFGSKLIASQSYYVILPVGILSSEQFRRTSRLSKKQKDML